MKENKRREAFRRGMRRNRRSGQISASRTSYLQARHFPKETYDSGSQPSQSYDCHITGIREGLKEVASAIRSVLWSLLSVIWCLWDLNPIPRVVRRWRKSHSQQTRIALTVRPRFRDVISDWFLSYEGRKRKLLQWVHSILPLLSEDVNDFGASWQDGIVLCALMDTLNPHSGLQVHLLKSHHRVNNCRLGIQMALTYLHINQATLSPEEMSLAEEGTEVKLVQLVQLVRWHFLKLGTKIKLDGQLTTEEPMGTVKCEARGTGIKAGIVGKRTKFNLFVDSFKHLHLCIEIKGPDNEYNKETIVSMHPRGPSRYISHVTITSTEDETKGKVIEDSEGHSFLRQKSLDEGLSHLVIPFDFQCVGEGRFLVTYIPRNAGIHYINVLLHGKHIHGSPFEVKVSDWVSSWNLVPKGRVVPFDMINDYVEGTKEGPKPVDKVKCKLSSVASVSKQLTMMRRRILKKVITQGGREIICNIKQSGQVASVGHNTDNADGFQQKSAPNTPLLSPITEQYPDDGDGEGLRLTCVPRRSTEDLHFSIRGFVQSAPATPATSTAPNSPLSNLNTNAPEVTSPSLLLLSSSTESLAAFTNEDSNGSISSVRQNAGLPVACTKNLMDDFKNINMDVSDKWKMAALKVSIKGIGSKHDKSDFSESNLIDNEENKQDKTETFSSSPSPNICIKITHHDSGTDSVDNDGVEDEQINKSVGTKSEECSRTGSKQQKMSMCYEQKPTTSITKNQRQMSCDSCPADNLEEHQRTPDEDFARKPTSPNDTCALTQRDCGEELSENFTKVTTSCPLEEKTPSLENAGRKQHPGNCDTKESDTINTTGPLNVKEEGTDLMTSRCHDNYGHQMKSKEKDILYSPEPREKKGYENGNLLSQSSTQRWSLLRQKYLEYVHKVRRSGRAPIPLKSSQTSSPGSLCGSVGSVEVCSVCTKNPRLIGTDECTCWVDSGNESNPHCEEIDSEECSIYSFNVDDVVVASDVTGDKLPNYFARNESDRLVNKKSEKCSESFEDKKPFSDSTGTPNSRSFVSFLKERKHSWDDNDDDGDCDLFFRCYEDFVDDKAWRKLRKTQSLCNDTSLNKRKRDSVDLLSEGKSHSFDCIRSHQGNREDGKRIRLLSSENDNAHQRVASLCLGKHTNDEDQKSDVEHTVSIVRNNNTIKSIFYIKTGSSDTFRSHSFPDSTTHPIDAQGSTSDARFCGQQSVDVNAEKRHDRFALVKKAWKSFDDGILNALKTNPQFLERVQENHTGKKKRAEISLTINPRPDNSRNDDDNDNANDNDDKDNEDILEVVIENDDYESDNEDDESTEPDTPCSIPNENRKTVPPGKILCRDCQAFLNGSHTLSNPRSLAILSPLSAEINKSDNSDWSDDFTPENSKPSSRKHSYSKREWSPSLSDFSLPLSSSLQTITPAQNSFSSFIMTPPSPLDHTPDFYTPKTHCHEISRISRNQEDSDALAEDSSISEYHSGEDLCEELNQKSTYSTPSKEEWGNKASSSNRFCCTNKDTSFKSSPFRSFDSFQQSPMSLTNVKVQGRSDLKNSELTSSNKVDYLTPGLNYHVKQRKPVVYVDGDMYISGLKMAHDRDTVSDQTNVEHANRSVSRIGNQTATSRNQHEYESDRRVSLETERGSVPFRERTLTPTKFRHVTPIRHQTKRQTDLLMDDASSSLKDVKSYEKEFCWDTNDDEDHFTERNLTPTKYRKQKDSVFYSTDNKTSNVGGGRGHLTQTRQYSSHTKGHRPLSHSHSHRFGHTKRSDRGESEATRGDEADDGGSILDMFLDGSKSSLDYHNFIRWMIQTNDVSAFNQMSFHGASQVCSGHQNSCCTCTKHGVNRLEKEKRRNSCKDCHHEYDNNNAIPTRCRRQHDGPGTHYTSCTNTFGSGLSSSQIAGTPLKILKRRIPLYS